MSTEDTTAGVTIENMEQDQKDFGPFDIAGKGRAMVSLGSTLDKALVNTAPFIILDNGKPAAREALTKLEGKVPHPEVKVPGYMWAVLKENTAVKYYLASERIRIK